MVNLGKLLGRLVVFLVLTGCLCVTGCGRKGAKHAAKRGREGTEEAARPASAASAAKWSRVRPGMTESELKNILGRPQQEGSGVFLWQEGPSQIMVTLVNGRARLLTATHLRRGGTALTATNADRVKTGMSESEVVAILGPGRNESLSDAAKTIEWKEDNKQILLTFLNGKLAYKQISGF